MALRLGCQGWNYPDWVGPFYPPRTARTRFLSTYARAFDTVEIDATFYAIPSVRTVQGWATQVPQGFLFSPKLPQEITHLRRFQHVGEIQAQFFEHMRHLGDRLGIVLCQCAPDFTPDEFEAFRAWVPTVPRDIRLAVEFRHKGWITKAVHELCGEHGIAIALSDGRWIPRAWLLQLAERPTADFAYVRWMGPNRAITTFGHLQRDVTAELDAWTPVLAGIRDRVATALGYCNNHFSGHAPATVRALQSRLGLRVVPPDTLDDQPTLFG
ncbi:MAG: DUF72 domain-containing protein [Gemmatimonadaceae bacterium]|nr:DUF72 domain-containing protein [Gemmatimonadaceae bacterium]